MDYKYLDVARDGHIVTITLSNPPLHTLVAPEAQELLHALGALKGDKDVRVVVLTGASDDVFIRHYEVGELAQISETIQGQSPEPSPTSENAREHHDVHKICLALEDLDAITIAAVNGQAGGGGCEVSLGCDFRLLKRGSHTYGLPETSVGILPGAGGTQRVARLLGTAKALDMILHARMMSPDEALALGLASRVYDAETFATEVKAFAEDLAARSPIGLQQAKRSILKGRDMSLSDALLFESDCFNVCMASRDAKEAMTGALKAAADGTPFVPKWEGV